MTLRDRAIEAAEASLEATFSLNDQGADFTVEEMAMNAFDAILDVLDSFELGTAFVAELIAVLRAPTETNE